MRPKGDGQFIGGWFAFISGLAFLLWSLLIDAKNYNGVDVDALASKWILLYLSGAAIGGAILLFMTGWIIRAISFLPGRDDAVFTTNQPELVLRTPVPLDDQDGSNIDEDRSRFMAWTAIFVLAVILCVVGYGIVARI